MVNYCNLGRKRNHAFLTGKSRAIVFKKIKIKKKVTFNVNNEKLKLWDAKRIILQDKQKKNKQGTKFLYINHNETTYANNSLKKVFLFN